ncbi:MAG: radical protein [Burkholderiales bacterium]|jgi:wyosine [tRNA(Phe)-imidazoG37] synthetase (radical SAM superfamily)|nr:radical protein [Burkholderiales bacterium]
MTRLTITDHSRIFAKYTYVYPVVSRRAQGVSLGINLNTNNACNWRCIYCQVEGLVRGKPNDVDPVRIEAELDEMLNWIINGDFIKKYAPKNLARFNDISLSGNGEPTLSPQFTQVIQIIAKLRLKYNLGNNIKTILITNGSEIDKPQVIDGLKLMSQNNGETWFKIDSVTEAGITATNQVSLSIDSIKKRLILASSLCKTYVQTCLFKLRNKNPAAYEIDEYIKFIVDVKPYIAGVLMYSTARHPALPEGDNVSSVSEEFLANVAKILEEHQIIVKYYV